MNEPYYVQEASCQIPPMTYLLEKYLGRRDYGTFVEIGGFDGVHASNTWGLAARGWRGLYVEPVPHYARACIENHRQHARIEVAEIAVASPDRNILELTVAGPLTTGHGPLEDAYSAISWAQEWVKDVSKITVSAMTADSLLESWLQADRAPLDLLVVDVEGMEPEVFSGLTLARWRPTMLIVELMDNHPEITAAAVPNARLYREILDQGYVVVFKNSLNTVFIDCERWDFVHGACTSECQDNCLHSRL